MPTTVERFDKREWSDEQLEALFAEGFPAFISADKDAKRYIERIRKWFPQLDIVLVDEDDAPVATGWGVPIQWSGDVSDLPAGFPATGDYVIPEGLSVLHIDRTADHGVYVEPNVWVRHR